MATAPSRAEKRSFCTVDFFHGENLAIIEKYTDLDDTYLGYTSEPRMALSIPANVGILDRKELRITLPLDPFTTRASSGVPHSPIFVRVREITRKLFAGDSNAQKVLYAGRVTRTIKNYQGEAGLVAFFALTQKARIPIPLGVPCTHHCIWWLFGGGCGASTTGHIIVSDIDSASGRTLTVTDAAITGQASGDDTYWKRGYLSKGGLSILIQDYDGSVDNTKFLMSRAVPSDWIGGTNDITFTAGCDKTIEVCRSRFDAEEFFGGMGFAMLPYNPNYEKA